MGWATRALTGAPLDRLVQSGTEHGRERDSALQFRTVDSSKTEEILLQFRKSGPLIRRR